MMKTLITAAIIAVPLVNSTPVLADWVRVAYTDDGADDFVQYVDPATIRRKGNIVKMWEMKDYKAPQMKLWGTFSSLKGQFAYDCVEEQMQSLAAIYYSGHMGSGSVVFSSYTSTEWRPVSPGSVGETVWKVACGKTKLK